MGNFEKNERTHLEHFEHEEWQSFIAAEIDKTLHVFRTKPKLLLSQVRDERQIADDYAGRELLELVQNAADAAAELDGKGRVHIAINREGLVVANTGQPFREGGVESLMTPHASDKPNRKAKLIGAKGLGFRALLNWSHEPIISSGNLEIGFSERHAASFVVELASQVPQISKICEDEEELPVPILAFPAYGAALDTFGSSVHKNLLRHARALRAAGFDTVVAAPFDSERAFELALQQVAGFEPTFLLFVDALKEIELNVVGQPPVRWHRSSTSADIYTLEVASSNQISTQDWLCLRKNGELALHGRNKPRLYELTVALPLGHRQVARYLHSYFPTSISVPFPALFHATLELDSNRKAIKQNSELNQKVLAELATFYATSLGQLVKAKRIANVLDFLFRDRAFPEPLAEFEQEVYRTIQNLAVIPVMRGNRRLRANDAKLGPRGYQSYLPSRLFGDLARCRDEKDRIVLERLGIEILSPAKIVQTLRRAELTIDERANAIAGVAANLHQKYHDRGLFLDQTGRAMQARNTLFPPPVSDDNLPQLPDWAKARFISPILWKRLLQRIDGQTPRDKIHRLIGFGITEYSNESVIASLRTQALRALTRGRRDSSVVKRELLRTIHALYKSDRRSPPGTFTVCCGDGVWRDARQVHLSDSYGQEGIINAALYRSAPHLLLAPAAENGLTENPVDRAAFFEWIGVNRWPRMEVIPLSDDLRDVVKRALPTTITVDDGNSHQTFGKNEILWGYNFDAQYSSIVGLDEILSTAESDAILAWHALDPRFDLSAPHAFVTTARGRKDGKANFRAYRGQLPDVVRERISSMPWLACRNELNSAPRDAMVEPGSLSELFNVPRPAAIGSKERFGLTWHLWRRGLENLQVPRGLSELSEARIFTLLRKVSEKTISEATVRALYNQVLALDSFDANKAPSERDNFLAHGRVQVLRARNREWVPVSEALYADQSGFPAAVRESLSLIDLPARRNTGNVLQRFGVKALSHQPCSLEVARLIEEETIVAAMLRSDFANARPFIRALRLADSNVTPRLRRFDRLTLTIASAAEIAVTLGDQRITGTIEPWTHVLHDETLIVAVNTCQEQAQVTTLANEAIADGIAELFDLQSGADFARLLSARDDGLRRVLLRRTLANLSDAEIDALLADIPAPEETYAPVKVDPEVLARGPTPSVNLTQPSGPSGPDTGATLSGTPKRLNGPNAVNSTAITPGPTVPALQYPTKGTIKLRVASATGPVGASTHPDPFRAADAEDWTKLFEISQGRFPLAVLHLQGRDSFGCDWLSFASETDRETFLKEPDRIDLVDRFIETKSGAIELSDTQARAAERQRSRFFIYRIHFIPGQRDRAELTVVSNPLAYRHALTARYEFRIDAVEDREQYQLVPEERDHVDEKVSEDTMLLASGGQN